MTVDNHKTIICSISCWDIIGYSKKTDAEQLALKNYFNDLINDALVNTPIDDRIILDTGDGAAIAFFGSPEDALFIAVKIQGIILETNGESLLPLELRVGINLGSVRIVYDINGRTNIIGDGINVGRSIMNFAKLNEILVSRSYYEATCRLTKELSEMFNHPVLISDENKREHEVYSVGLRAQESDTEFLPLAKHIRTTTVIKTPLTSTFNNAYGLTSLIILLVLFTTVNLTFVPHSNKVNFINSVSAQSNPISISSTTSNELEKTNFTKKNLVLANITENFNSESKGIPSEKSSKVDDSVEVKKTSHSRKKKVSNKITQVSQMQSMETQSSSPTDKANTEFIEAKKDKYSDKVAFSIPEDSQTQFKSNWYTLRESIKQGKKSNCTQSEIAIGQCH